MASRGLEVDDQFWLSRFCELWQRLLGAAWESWENIVYVHSQDSDSAYEPADRMVMARVPKDKIRVRDAYEFFVWS